MTTPDIWQPLTYDISQDPRTFTVLYPAISLHILFITLQNAQSCRWQTALCSLQTSVTTAHIMTQHHNPADFNHQLAGSSWNVMAHGDSWEGTWRGNWQMEWVASTLHTTSEHGVSSITTADAHNSAASSRLNWRPRRFKWTRPFFRNTKSYFCACAITFQTRSTALKRPVPDHLSLGRALNTKIHFNCT
jgi:hypothetical protein